MKGQMHTDLGQVIIDEEVIATYADSLFFAFPLVCS